MQSESSTDEASIPADGMPLGIPNLSDAIEKLKAHPEILQMAASVLGGQHTEADALPEEASDEISPAPDGAVRPQAEPPVYPDLMRLASPLLANLSAFKSANGVASLSKGLSRSTALLLALKPFLSSSRCETVDKIVQVSKIGALLGQAGTTEK